MGTTSLFAVDGPRRVGRKYPFTLPGWGGRTYLLPHFPGREEMPYGPDETLHTEPQVSVEPSVLVQVGGTVLWVRDSADKDAEEDGGRNEEVSRVSAGRGNITGSVELGGDVFLTSTKIHN